jgi:AcrR family transcriptional regulator
MPATKDEIAQLFWRHVEHYGFPKTSVEEVARELGISKRTVYQYFSSKEDILHYVIENAALRIAERIESEYAAEPTFWGRLERLVRDHVLRSTREWLDRYQQTEARHQFELGVRINREAFDGLIRRWLAAGAKVGEFRLVRDEAFTAAMIGAILTTSIERIREDRDTDVDDSVVEAIRKLLA